jgi:general secretion pathway protein B
MSYILDALRRADADRERGAVPRLATQQVLPPVADDGGSRAARAAWLGAGVGTALVAVAVAGWWFGRGGAAVPASPPAAREASPVAAAPQRAEASVAGQTPTAQPPSSGTAASAPAAADPPAPKADAASAPARNAEAAVKTAAAPQPAAAAARPQPQAQPKAQASRPTRPSAPAARQATAAPAPRVNAAPAVAAPSPAQAPAVAAAPAAPEPKAAARVPALNELPEDLRRLVPPMAMGGSVYSAQPSARMVIVNGQVFQEGSTLAPDLQLEQIRPKSAVFSIRGQRFEVPL